MNTEEIAENVDILTDSLKEKESYRLFLKTSLTVDKIQKNLSIFGTGVFI